MTPMNTVVIAAAALVLGGLAAVPVSAQMMGPQGSRPGGGPMMQSRVFDAMDANKDGQVTREEYDAYQAKRFDRFDANKDGKITRDEFMGHDGGPPGRGGMRDAEFKAYDKNGDGVITREEWNAWAAERFAARDKNGDGKLTRDEMGPVHRGMRQGSNGQMPMQGGTGPMRGMGPGR